jgi:hypothetical protein
MGVAVRTSAEFEQTSVGVIVRGCGLDEFSNLKNTKKGRKIQNNNVKQKLLKITTITYWKVGWTWTQREGTRNVT